MTEEQASEIRQKVNGQNVINFNDPETKRVVSYFMRVEPDYFTRLQNTVPCLQTVLLGNYVHMMSVSIAQNSICSIATRFSTMMRRKLSF